MWRRIIDDYRLEYLNDLFEIKLIFYGLSGMLQFSQFVWALRYSNYLILSFLYLCSLIVLDLLYLKLFNLRDQTIK